MRTDQPLSTNRHFLKQKWSHMMAKKRDVQTPYLSHILLYIYVAFMKVKCGIDAYLDSMTVPYFANWQNTVNSRNDL